MSSEHSGLKRKKDQQLGLSFKKRSSKNYDVNLKSTYLEPGVIRYFQHVVRQSHQTFNNEDEKREFVDGVFKSMVGNEVKFSKNYIVVEIIRTLLPYACENALERFMAAFVRLEESREILYYDHVHLVLERLICLASKAAIEGVAAPKQTAEDGSDGPGEHASQCLAFVLEVFQYMLRNLDEVSKHTFGNRVLCTAVRCLCGAIPAPGKGAGTKNKFIYLFKEKGAEFDSIEKGATRLPPEFVSILRELGRDILHTPYLSDYVFNTCQTKLLQTVLLSLFVTKSGTELSQQIVRKLLEVIYRPDTDDPAADQFFTNVLDKPESGRLLEAMIFVTDEKLFAEIYSVCCVEHLVKMVSGGVSTSVLQALIHKCQDVKLFESIYDNLSQDNGFSKMLAGDRAGLLVALCQACRRLDSKQPSFVKDLSAAFGIQDDDSAENSQLVLQLLKMTPGQTKKFQYYKSDSPSYPINHHGSLIVEEMMAFRENVNIIESFLSIPIADLLYILSTSRGSYISNAFLKIDGVAETKCVDKFREKLKGSWVTLATTKFGSVTFLELWKDLTDAQKSQVVEELAVDLPRVMGTHSGRSVAVKIDLHSYCDIPAEYEMALAQQSSE